MPRADPSSAFDMSSSVAAKTYRALKGSQLQSRLHMLIPSRVGTTQTIKHVRFLTKCIEHSHTYQLAYSET